ncbi:hypothetical protein DSL64_03315 [Dyadobacter luteus]|uniref:Uncharacterized protein n=1 Tax=Dyadobacter luteus TaxID=2259619 RepID=A0A3D8YIK8_9BACT|nr:helix-turn-helix domain-containing protein [Dyadobacter luteus]REA63490.1 hypothetical protein DSL64_03315 [Dyadobacter luteus]
MENPVEVLIEYIDKRMLEMESRLMNEIAMEREHIPGIDLDRYIPLQKVAEMYGVSPQTLSSHKSRIDHVKHFNQIFFVKESLLHFMESGRPTIEGKKVMYEVC